MEKLETDKVYKVSKVEMILMQEYSKTEDFEILLYVITHKKDFSTDMIKWVTEKIKTLD